VEYRRITPADVDTVASFAIEGMRPHLYPMHLSPEKVRHVIEHFAHSTRDFQLAAFDGDRMVGGIAALVSDMLWFERCEAHVVMLYATRAGVGRELVRRMFEWVHDQPSIRRVLWAVEFDAPVATMRWAERAGFNSFNTVASFYKV
jgi:hypothetical protein